MSRAPERDPAEILDFLAMACYVVGALWAMVSLIPALRVFVAFEMSDTLGLAADEAPAVAPTATMAVVAAAIVVLGLVGGALTVWCGRCLAARRRLRVARGVAWLLWIFVPIGTLLGAVILTYLGREEIRRRFTG